MGHGGRRSTTFKKGDKRASQAGKKSSNALPVELKEARLQNANEFEESLYKYMGMSYPDLKQAFKDVNTCARDLAVIQILMKAIKDGDYRCLDFLLDRTIGKVKQNLELSGQVNFTSMAEALEGSETQKFIDVTPELNEPEND